MKFDAQRIASQMQTANPGITPGQVSGLWAMYQAALASGLPEITARATGSYKWDAIGDGMVLKGVEKLTVASFFNELLAYNAGWVEADSRVELGKYRGSISEFLNQQFESAFPGLEESAKKVVKTIGVIGGIGLSLYALSVLTRLVRGK